MQSCEHDVGIGLRQPHYQALLQGRPALGFVEVHSENFFADGGAALAVLQAARERWPVSLHGVGLSLGSAAGLDDWHLDRLDRLVRRIDPVRVSDHASFARAPRQAGAAPVHANDLLPVAFTEAALGADIAVPTLDGKVTLRVPPGTASGRTFRVKDKGVATAQGTGDLLVTVEVTVPQHLSDQARALLDQLRRAEAGHTPRAHLGV